MNYFKLTQIETQLREMWIECYFNNGELVNMLPILWQPWLDYHVIIKIPPQIGIIKSFRITDDKEILLDQDFKSTIHASQNYETIITLDTAPITINGFLVSDLFLKSPQKRRWRSLDA